MIFISQFTHILMFLQILTDKNLPKIESPSKHLNCETPASRNRVVVKPAPPKSTAKSPNDGIKSLSKTVAPPVTYFKLPSSHRTWSDQRVSWSGLPKTIQLLGKVRCIYIYIYIDQSSSSSNSENQHSCVSNFSFHRKFHPIGK